MGPQVNMHTCYTCLIHSSLTFKMGISTVPPTLEPQHTFLSHNMLRRCDLLCVQVIRQAIPPLDSLIDLKTTKYMFMCQCAFELIYHKRSQLKYYVHIAIVDKKGYHLEFQN